MLNIHLAHHSNILSRVEKSPEPFKGLLLEHEGQYQPSIATAVVAGNFVELANIVNSWRRKIREIEIKHSIKVQGKLYSSILEELPVLMFRLLVEQGVREFHRHEFTFGSTKCLIRMGVRMSGTYTREHKNIDCALAFRNLDNEWICLAGLEVKRYVDKVMFATILHTIDAMRAFQPKSFYGFCVEDEARAEQEVESSPCYDREFLLTGKKRPENDMELHDFTPENLEHFYNVFGAAINRSLQFLKAAS